jgi:NADP-dependent 3-hydroxy acid dehydrogenase YdfG
LSAGFLIIVGAGPGVSLATARRFGKEGYAVALIARREANLKVYCEDLEADGIRTLYRVADCANDTELSTAMESLQVEAPVPAVLLYNAANIKWKNLLDDTAAGLTADFQVNVAGALTAARAVVPRMRVAKRGTLLLTGSLFATDPSPAFGSLSVSKAGLRNLAHGLKKSLHGTGIRVHYLAIQGRVTADDPQRSPTLIAERCWQLASAFSGIGPVDVVI